MLVNKRISAPYYRTQTLASNLAKSPLKTPTDPVPENLKTSIQKTLEVMFAVRQLDTHLPHTPLELERMSIRQQRSDGSTAYHAIVVSETVHVTGGDVDFIVTDASGRVLSDSKAERIAALDKGIDLFLGGNEQHPLVHALLKSYRTAVDDPANELIHLYEIRDALVEHFTERFGKKDHKTRQRLKITKADWNRLGDLANDEPLEQGRHRGAHLMNLRPATPQELAEARVIAKKLIKAFIDTL